MPNPSKGSALRARLAEKKFLFTPGLTTPLQAMIIEKAGYDPIKSVEVRLEARYDSPTDNSLATAATSKSAQAWVEAYYKF